MHNKQSTTLSQVSSQSSRETEPIQPYPSSNKTTKNPILIIQQLIANKSQQKPPS